VSERRMKAAGGLGGYSNYPRIPVVLEYEPLPMQYRMPRPDITRYLLPSYANHVLTAAAADGRRPAAVKVYRLEHRFPAPRTVAEGGPYSSPHHPTWFRPYFLGEFRPDPATGKAELADPQDPMLYWLVPILPRAVPVGEKNGTNYVDYMSKHAGYTYDWSRRIP
jgi:hypothetical protein